MTGKCKWFDKSKGYGFVTDDLDSKKEYFFHHTKTLDVIRTDDRVNFDLIETPRGLNAVDVSRIKI
jgi:CspA family cold shock protein